MLDERRHTPSSEERRKERRRRARLRTVRRRRVVAGASVVAIVGMAAIAISALLPAHRAAEPAPRPPSHTTTHPFSAGLGVAIRPMVARPRAPKLVETSGGSLDAPMQDAATATVGTYAVAVGGLTAQGTSTSDVIVVARGTSRIAAHLPAAQHDAGAVSIGSSVYVFGGGDGVRQLDHILRVDPTSGRVTTVGRMPQPSSDSVAAAVGSTAYVIGGYDGTRWLDTIVAFGATRKARIVAHLPNPLRYAAASSVGGLVVIAGGSLPDGSASRAIYTFDPTRNRVKLIGRLPVATTHAAAATIGHIAYVIGGRSAVPGTPIGTITAIDPARKKVTPAGSLRTPLSDLSAATVGSQILVIGGRAANGTTSAIRRLQRAARSPAQPDTTTRTLATTNVYAATGSNMLGPVTRRAKALVYVPNSQSNTVDVIDQHTFKVIRHFAVGALPQHVTPSWDLKTLYVDNDRGNSLTPIDPVSGRQRGPPIPVDDPYNLYFTPNGRYAIVVAEALRRLDFRDAQTMRLHRSLAVPCRGIDHIDFTADGKRMLASCEFSSQMVVVDVARERVIRALSLPRAGSMPQDVKLAPDGVRFFVADMMHAGIWMIDARSFRVTGFLHTGAGAHGLYPSRDAKLLYVSNRAAGSISVVSFATRRIVKTWRIPGGTPDMGGVSADGRVLWLSGRYRSEVYAIDTRSGKLIARIPVGSGPHGLAVWPQPGRYSLGHTGILR